MIFTTDHTLMYSVGYQGRASEDFLNLLTTFDIQVLADIRANPYSRGPNYSRTQLQSAVTDRGIEYDHIKTLGVPQSIRDILKTTGNRHTYATSHSAHLHAHLAVLQELSQQLRRKTYCLMCLERSHRSCHRLITTDKLNRLNDQQLTICHL